MSEFYFSNRNKVEHKPEMPKHGCTHNHGCKCGCNYGGDYGYLYPMEDTCVAKCEKYTEISNKKCEEASELNKDANEVAQAAAAMERKAEELQAAANRAACEAMALWNKYNAISEQSSMLLKEAQKALEEGIKCQKKCNHGLMYDGRPCCSDCKPCCKKC